MVDFWSFYCIAELYDYFEVDFTNFSNISTITLVEVLLKYSLSRPMQFVDKNRTRYLDDIHPVAIVLQFAITTEHQT